MTKSMNTAIAALLLIAMIALACGGQDGDMAAEDDSQRVETTSTDQQSTEPEVSDQEEEPEEPEEEIQEQTREPMSDAPERIRFRKGATEGRIQLVLAPNETKRYVVGVAPAQYFHIGIDDETPLISIPDEGRLTEIEKGGYYFSAVTISTGDVVFRISNPTRNSIRTFAIVTINDREPMDH